MLKRYNNNVMLFRTGTDRNSLLLRRVFLPVHKKPLVVCGQLLVSGLCNTSLENSELANHFLETTCYHKPCLDESDGFLKILV